MKFRYLSCSVFILGLMLSGTFLSADLTPYESFPVNVEIVQIYAKIFNVSASSGIGYDHICSYILILNISNPSESTLKLNQVRIFGDPNNGINYRRDFSEQNTENSVPSNCSRLIALSSLYCIDDTGSGKIITRTWLLTGYLQFSADKTRSGAHFSFTDNEFKLNRIGDNEYRYGTTFNESSYFVIRDDSINPIFGGSSVIK
jgi:hypothetical protein